jgi:hypothetical protein
MDGENKDVVHVDLKPEEKAQIESKPVEAVEKTEPVKETEVKEVKEVKEPVKEVKEVKPTKFEDVFKADKPKAEVKDMTPDERTEYETLKKEKLIQEHQNAYEDILAAYEPEEREILQVRLDKILKEKENPEEDLFGKLSGLFNPKQVAYITTAIAQLEEMGELEKIRAKKLNTAVKDASEKATKSAEVKQTLTEIADLSTIGEGGEVSPTEKRRKLIEKGYKGDKRTREDAVLQLVKGKLSK